MSAVAAVRAVLISNAALTALVPASRIFLSDLPQGTALPAIGIHRVGGSMHLTVSMREARRGHAARVQIDISTTTPAQRETLMALVRAAVPNTAGLLGGVQVLSILPALDGPDTEIGNPTIYSASRDYRVTFIE